MKPINIYALTRISDALCMQKAERQFSERNRFLSVKKWEIESLEQLDRHLCENMENGEQLKFYYSFQIPRLGKEFDLLRITDSSIVSIELKSEPVEDERIIRQLMQNRYYLSLLNRTMRFYTYISSEDRLVRLSNSGKLAAAEWSQLCQDLAKQNNQEKLYEEDIEDLFRTEEYILSPITQPEKFLQKEYFLTSQQRDIERRILKKLKTERSAVQGFTGLPGTGKSLLLFDLALSLSARQRVCLIHCGEYPSQLSQINERLKRVDIMRLSDFLSETQEKPSDLPSETNCSPKIGSNLHCNQNYAAILIDEAHWMTAGEFYQLEAYLKACENRQGRPAVIFSYDQEECISPEEMDKTVIHALERRGDYTRYRLTNRIRSNAELSTFIQCLMHPIEVHNTRDYPDIQVYYANDDREAEILMNACTAAGDISIAPVESAESEVVAVELDARFYYDDHHYLRCRDDPKEGTSVIRQLFHDLNRAKNRISLIIVDNPSLFETILKILQPEARR